MRFESNALYQAVKADVEAMHPNDAPDASIDQFASHYLLTNLLKKFTESTSEGIEERTILKFLHVNENCRTWELSEATLLDELLIGTFQSKIWHFFEPGGYPLISTLGDCLDLGRTGPGAAHGVPAWLSDHYSKLWDSVLTTTKRDLYIAYSKWCFESPLRNAAENRRAWTHGSYALLNGNKMFFVPKDTDWYRIAFSEPSLNMFYQLGIGEKILARLKACFNISLDTQPLCNRELARRGSLFDGFATIDLSSASDSISLRMLKKFLPRTMYDMLYLTRSPVAKMPDGGEVELHMVSTMGNGFTFPLETALFTCAVSAVYDVFGVSLKRNTGDARRWTLQPGNFGVFGDDIVVIKELAPHVIRLLSLLGFTVNESKTSIVGKFRESCGCDYYLGHNVRPFFIRKAKTKQELYIAINGFNDWTSRTRVPLPRTVEYLMRCIPGEPGFVPLHESDDAGIRVPLALLTDVTYGVEPMTHRNKERVTTRSEVWSSRYSAGRVIPVSTKHHAIDQKQKPGSLIKYMRELGKPCSKHFGEEWVEGRRGKTYRLIISDKSISIPKGAPFVRIARANPDGKALACLGGYIRTGVEFIRADVLIYQTNCAFTPNWDAERERDCLPVREMYISDSVAIQGNLVRCGLGEVGTYRRRLKAKSARVPKSGGAGKDRHPRTSG